MLAIKDSKLSMGGTSQALVIFSMFGILYMSSMQCPHFGPETSIGELRKAVKRNRPMVIDVPELARYKDAERQHWSSLFPEDFGLKVSVSHNRGFYNSFRDTTSPIGISIVYPYQIEELLAWEVVKMLMRFRAQRGQGKEVEIATYFPRKYVELLKRPSNVWYIEGNVFGPQVWDFVKTRELTNIKRRFMKVQAGEGENVRSPRVTTLRMSAGNTSTRVHIDESDNWLCQFVGNKTFTLFHPDESANLYPIKFDERGGKRYSSVLDERTGRMSKQALHENHEDGVFGAVDAEDVDPIWFPLYKNATSLSCTLLAGQCIWIPTIWYHRVVSGDSGINLSLNFWFGNSREELLRMRGFDLKAQYDRIGDAIEKTANYLRHLSKSEVPLIKWKRRKKRKEDL